MKLISLWLLCLSCALHAQDLTIPVLGIEPAGEETFELDWHGEPSHVYFLQFSDDLVDWFYCPDIREGFDETIAYGLWSDSDRLFFRVQLTNQSYTNPHLDDFDSDGIANWVEVELMSSNPLKADSDGDGTSDLLEDSDSDGLSDVTEALWGKSNLRLADTDGDGIDDAAELAMGLDPFLADTDGDGVNDGLDPLGLVANESILADSTPSSGPSITILTPEVTLLP